MKTIYCVMGKSSSGKDAIGKGIRALSGMGELTACTTRPMRVGEEEGNPYHFIKESQAEVEMICKTLFHREDGSYYYGFVNEDLDESMNYLIVVNPNQIKEICDRYGKKFHIICLYIQADEEERILHAIEREGREENPNYKEICRRFQSDHEDFREENEIMEEIYDICDDVVTVYNDYEMTPEEIAMEVLSTIRI